MAEDSMLWTTSGTGDGPGGGYTQQNWLDFHRYIFTPDTEATAGVLPRKGNKLAVAAGASQVTVDTGAAFVYGFFYKNTALLTLAITTPSVGTTGFRVVLRASWAAQTVRAAVVRNTDGLSAIPAATQSAGTTWEVTIATGTITTGGVVTPTDARVYLKPALNPDTSWVDGATLELTAADVVRVKDGGISLTKLAADSVDDTKAGNRVPQFYRRQGGDANAWGPGGTNNYTPTMVRQMCGAASVTITSGTASSTVAVTFPVSFSDGPNVPALALLHNGTAGVLVARLSALSATGFTAIVQRGNESNFGASITATLLWFVSGPE